MCHTPRSLLALVAAAAAASAKLKKRRALRTPLPAAAAGSHVMIPAVVRACEAHRNGCGEPPLLLRDLQRPTTASDPTPLWCALGAELDAAVWRVRVESRHAQRRFPGMGQRLAALVLHAAATANSTTAKDAALGVTLPTEIAFVREMAKQWDALKDKHSMSLDSALSDPTTVLAACRDLSGVDVDRRVLLVVENAELLLPAGHHSNKSGVHSPLVDSICAALGHADHRDGGAFVLAVAGYRLVRCIGSKALTNRPVIFFL